MIPPLDMQKELGNLIEKYMMDLQMSTVSNVLAVTLLSALSAAVMLPAIILRATNVIDGTWSVAIIRAGDSRE